MGRARSVRSEAATVPPRTSRATSATACRPAWTITGDILRMEMTPATKMPPMPTGRTQVAKMASADMAVSGPAAGGRAPARCGPNQAKSGTSAKKETSEPARMMAA
jgi:hypothetical protein